jgi:hypothetical protein
MEIFSIGYYKFRIFNLGQGITHKNLIQILSSQISFIFINAIISYVKPSSKFDLNKPDFANPGFNQINGLK